MKIFLALLFLWGCADSDSQVNIFGGMPASHFLSSSHVRIQVQTESKKFFCTGVFIQTEPLRNPVFVTQAHCFLNNQEALFRYSILFEFFSHSGTKQASCYPLSLFLREKPHGLTDAPIESINYDLALGELSSYCVPKDLSFLPLISLERVKSFSDPFFLIQTGYGKRQESEKLSLKQDQKLFYLLTQIDWKKRRFRSEIITKTQSEQNTCQGDSGGSLIFFQPKSKKKALLGTLFGATGRCDANGGSSTYLEVNAHRHWMQKVLKRKMILLP